MDYFAIGKREVNGEDVLSDHGVSNAKINELESLVREMKNKLDKVTEVG